MQTYISFLRGINMAGHYPVKMSDLSLLFKELGYTNIMTYIQSGNVIFTSTYESEISDISLKIQKAILEKYSYNVPVLIRTAADLKDIISANPFYAEENFDPSKLIAILLYEKPSEAQIQKVINIEYPPDKFVISGDVIFVYCPDGFGRSKLYTGFFEKKMDVTGTARNWRTIVSILELATKE